MLLLTAAPAGAASVTGGELAMLCRAADREPCLGWIRARWQAIEGGMWLIAESGGGWLFCQPPDLTLDAVRTTFVDWAVRHPQRLSNLDRTVLTEALQEAYPCPPENR